MKKFLDNINSAFEAEGIEESRDSGELVSLVITIAGFAVAAILVVNWFSTSILNKAADSALCIEKSSVYAKNTDDACSTSTHSGGANSFTKNKGYTDRFTGK